MSVDNRGDLRIDSWALDIKWSNGKEEKILDIPDEVAQYIDDYLTEAINILSRNYEPKVSNDASHNMRKIAAMSLAILEIEEKIEKNETVELSEEKVMGTKFSMSVQTIIGLVSLISAGVGGYYMLLQEIEEAKELPKIDIEAIYSDEYPSRPEGHNWPSSKEQYKQQVGSLQDDVDDMYDTLEEMEDEVKELKKLVSDLRVQVANKRDK